MLARLSLAVLIAASLAAAPAIGKEKLKSDASACTGIFGPDSSAALLERTFGAENVETGTLYGPEGIEYLGTTLFGDDPGRRMIFTWYDDEALEALSSVDLSPAQIGPLGLRVGQSVAEVEAINGAPFDMNGFWWDYGGYAVIDTGAIRDAACPVVLRFAPGVEETADLDTSPVAGDKFVSSHEPLLETLDVRLQLLSLSHPVPEHMILSTDD